MSEAPESDITVLKQEWKRFSSALFHDLAPISRRIDSYARMISMELDKEEWNKEEIKEYGASITTAASSLGKIILGMREYSNATTWVPVWEGIEWEMLWEDLKETYPELSLNITSALPAFTNNQAKLQQALSKLLDNAFISTQDISQPTVELEVQVENAVGEIRFVVTDNGIGFKPASTGKMFSLFEKAHDSKTYLHEGAGAGLPIAQKVAHALGGKIVAEGMEGKGASFSLILPLVSPQAGT